MISLPMCTRFDGAARRAPLSGREALARGDLRRRRRG